MEYCNRRRGLEYKQALSDKSNLRLLDAKQCIKGVGVVNGDSFWFLTIMNEQWSKKSKVESSIMKHWTFAIEVGK